MPRQPAYNAAEAVDASHIQDPYLRPSYSVGNRVRRLLWGITWTLVGRTSFRTLHGWRSFLLRSFGANLGTNCKIYPKVTVWAPWNLVCEQNVTMGDGAEIYNPATMTFRSHSIVSQGAYICGATHDYNDPAFPVLAYTMEFGAYSWICARATVGPGVQVAEGAVLGLASVATRSMDAWGVYAGAPAVRVRDRTPFATGT